MRKEYFRPMLADLVLFCRKGRREDIFIPEENANGASQGDEVEFVITKAPERKTKEKENCKDPFTWNYEVVGLYEKSKSFGFVRPDNQRVLKDIYIPAKKKEP